jgi:hypothetical protein
VISPFTSSTGERAQWNVDQNQCLVLPKGRIRHQMFEAHVRKSTFDRLQKLR